jgi:hypothetical protein
MNWFMVAVGAMQYGAAVYSCYTGSMRMALMNACVATANIALAGVRA